MGRPLILPEEVVAMKKSEASVFRNIERIFLTPGAHVILACRNIKRAQPAADKIKLETNNNNVEVEILDLASLQSVRDFADRIKKRFKRIDILVNNAGKS